MRIGYFTNLYPAVSHTFVRREIHALRARAIEVETFTIRRTPDLESLSEVDRAEGDATWTILPVEARELLIGHALTAARHPLRYASALKLALGHRAPGARSALWSVFHFAEGVRLGRELEARGLQHLRVHFGATDTLIAMVAARVAGIGWSLGLHGSPCFDGLRTLLAGKIASADFTTCVSNYGRAQAMWASEPELWDRISLVRCGVEVELLARSAAPRPARPRARIASVCRLSPEKGLLGLIAAFSDAAAGGLDAELVLAGDGPERPRLEAEIARRGLQGRVTLLGGLSHADALREIAAADVFVTASFMEGLPVVLMEAMALGTPVIAPRLTGIPELIEHERHGLLFTPAVWEELRGCMVRLLADRPFAAALAENARARVREEFDAYRASEPLIDLISGSIARRARR